MSIFRRQTEQIRDLWLQEREITVDAKLEL